MKVYSHVRLAGDLLYAGMFTESVSIFDVTLHYTIIDEFCSTAWPAKNISKPFHFVPK